MAFSAYGLYIVQAQLGKSDPNPVSWFLWSYLATLNALSFSAMNDRVAALQFFAGSVGCLATFFYVLIIGRFKWPIVREWWMLVLGSVAIIGWQQFTATTANMILAGILIYSFEPSIRGVHEDPWREKPLAWWMWTIAFGLTGLNTFLFKGGWTLSLVMPVVGVVCHALVAILCSDGRQRRLTALAGSSDPADSRLFLY